MKKVLDILAVSGTSVFVLAALTLIATSDRRTLISIAVGVVLAVCLARTIVLIVDWQMRREQRKEGE